MRAARWLLLVALASGGVCVEPGAARAAGADDFFGPAPRAVAAPPAPPATRFGERGQFVIGGDSNVGLQWTGASAAVATSLTFNFAPTLDYFAWHNLSLGIDANFDYSLNQGSGGQKKLLLTHLATAAAGVRVGYDVAFGRYTSVWPALTLDAESVHRDESLEGGGPNGGTRPVPTTPSTLVGPLVALAVPLVVEIAPHLVVGVGPTVLHEFAPAAGGPQLGGQRTSFTFNALLGGYFGGDAVARAPVDAPSAPSSTRRFGDAHEIVLTNDDALGAHFVSYAGTDTTTNALSFTLGLDYFVVRYLSVGAVAAGSYQWGVGPVPLRATNSSWSLSPGGRVGVDIPLGSRLSVYPRALVTVGPGESESVNVTRGAASNTSVDVALTVGAPLLVHASSHFFVGFGPTLYRDLWKPISRPGGSTVNDQTMVGGELLVGGWL